jgi:hypothetical protein
MSDRTNISSIPKNIFSLAITLYLIVFGIIFVFVSQVFGSGAAIFLSLIPLFPLLIAIRMRIKWQTLKGRELVYLGVLLIITFCSVPGLIWYWYDLGMDHFYAEHIERLEFLRLLHNDPAFQSLKLVERKGCWLEGTVPLESDLDRLKSFVDSNNSTIYCGHVTFNSYD